METILGIDLGTTNSVVAVVRDGKPTVIRDAHGRPTLPSVVGLDADGKLLVGEPARNQAVLAPQRTIRSIKRQMGEDLTVAMGDKSYAPQEISAMILRTLKQRAEREIGKETKKAVITVPAYFSENQRGATREAGELAGLEVVRIINEPTAASLAYEPASDKDQKLLIYDLGGGTFDVSVVQIEDGVVEVLASHGDTHLGGDDFDQLLLDHVCDQFKEEYDIDLRETLIARSRLLDAVESAKILLSTEACITIQEEFIVEKDGKPLNLIHEIQRPEYESLIEPLLQKTLEAVDRALADANLNAKDIDRVVLVGGATRTPCVHDMLQEQLGQEPHLEVDPDLGVALGAATQAGMITGVDVGPVLVDITPHTLGIRAVRYVDGVRDHRRFSAIINRNSALPASRSNMYYTSVPGQEVALIEVFQGEQSNVDLNVPVGSFELEGLDEDAEGNSEILVRFELDLDGTLKVTAVERATSLEKQMTVDNAVTRFRADSHAEAKQKLAEMFCDSTPPSGSDTGEADDGKWSDLPDAIRNRLERGQQLVSKAHRLAPDAPQQDAEEIGNLVTQLDAAIQTQSTKEIDELSAQLDDLLFYLEDV